jgi:hypothetical protein
MRLTQQGTTKIFIKIKHPDYPDIYDRLEKFDDGTVKGIKVLPLRRRDYQ